MEVEKVLPLSLPTNVEKMSYTMRLFSAEKQTHLFRNILYLWRWTKAQNKVINAQVDLKAYLNSFVEDLDVEEEKFSSHFCRFYI